MSNPVKMTVSEFEAFAKERGYASYGFKGGFMKRLIESSGNHGCDTAYLSLEDGGTVNYIRLDCYGRTLVDAIVIQ